MLDISLDKALERMTFISYGGTLSGKTRFAASWPRPLFLSDATEGGWKTIAHMTDDAFYEPGVKPLVWAMSKMTDFQEAITRAQPLVASGKVKSIIVDSVTFYADMYLAHLAKVMPGNNLKIYGALGEHLREFRTSLHSTFPNTHIGWLALVEDPDEDSPMGGPLIPGKQGKKFGPACDYRFYHRTWGDKEGTHFAVHTRTHGKYPAGGRDGGILPNPLPDATYASLVASLANEPTQEEIAAVTMPTAPVKFDTTQAQLQAQARRAALPQQPPNGKPNPPPAVRRAAGIVRAPK